MRGALRFWGWAVGVAAGFAAAAALLFPYGALGLHTAGERERAWLVTVWTAGALLVLFGLTARVGGFRGIGAREVVEAGSVRGALDARRRADAGGASGTGGGFDLWIVATGAVLIGIYFAGWMWLG